MEKKRVVRSGLRPSRTTPAAGRVWGGPRRGVAVCHLPAPEG